MRCDVILGNVLRRFGVLFYLKSEIHHFEKPFLSAAALFVCDFLACQMGGVPVDSITYSYKLVLTDPCCPFRGPLVYQRQCSLEGGRRCRYPKLLRRGVKELLQ